MSTEWQVLEDDRAAMVAAARQYYLEDLSKSQIATNLGISRFKVARLLTAAREQGVVSIRVDDRATPVPDLAQQLVEALNLTRAVVVETPADPEEARRLVGSAAAAHLGETLSSGEVVGMAWGRTLTAMSAAMPSLPQIDVVQLTGAVGSDLEMSPVEILRRVALNAGGSATPIFAPLVVDDAQTADALRRQPDVARAIRMFDTVTTAVVAVGSIEPPTSQLWDSLDRIDQERLRAAGAVAEVVASLVNDDGEVIDPEFDQRCIAISADQLRRTRRVVAIAAGSEKARAVSAISRGRLCTEVVTDRALAQEVLRLAGTGTT